MQFYDNLLGHELSAEFNNRGHRCKDIEDIDLHKYFLFVGDNISLGLGTPIEETYPYLISKRLDADYYNLSIFNGGLDAIKYNLLAWESFVKHPPRAIIISTEFLNSFLVSNHNYDFLNACDLSNENVREVLDAGNTTGFFNGRIAMTRKLVSNMIHIPIYQITFKDKEPLLTDNIFHVQHDGELHDHSSIADLVVREINKVRTRVRP